MRRTTTGTPHRGRDGDFGSQRVFLLPDNDHVLKPISGILQIDYRRFGHQRLDEKLDCVISRSARQKDFNFGSYLTGGKDLSGC